MDIPIPVWVGIQLRASYFRLAQFPALPLTLTYQIEKGAEERKEKTSALAMVQPVHVKKKKLPKATLRIASARRLLQEQLPSSSARLLACEARQ